MFLCIRLELLNINAMEYKIHSIHPCSTQNSNDSQFPSETKFNIFLFYDTTRFYDIRIFLYVKFHHKILKRYY